jgi:acetyltransferase-like isoleucine patch superfamily enzyme
MDRRLRDIAQLAFSKLDRWQRRSLEIRSGDAIARRFASFGSDSVIGYPRVELVGTESVVIGNDVTIRSYVAIEAMSTPDKVVLRVGDRSHIGHHVRFVAVNGIFLEDDVGIGHGTTIADTIHVWKDAADDQVAWQTPLKVGRPITIGRGAWIGNLCTITGGITIGAGSIIRPSSVITRDVPPDTMVGGNPPQVLRRKIDGRWEWMVDPSAFEIETR